MPKWSCLKLCFVMALAVLAVGARADLLFSNGPVVGADGLSITQAQAVTLGFGAQTKSSNATADDFTISGASWNLTSFDFFAYQNNAKAFTLQTVSWSIVSGDLNNGTLMASGITALTNGGLVGYRVPANDLGNTSKPIYLANADIADLMLDEGHYWLRWSFTGSLTSGPWQPPTADARTGNAAQSQAGSGFATLLDQGSQRTVELPFVLNGTVVNAVPEPSTPALLMVAGLALVGAMRRRRS